MESRINNELELSKYEKLYKYLKMSIIFNNESSLVDGNVIGGNQTDKAIRKFINTVVPNVKVVDTIPFDSKNKYSSSKVNYNNMQSSTCGGIPNNNIGAFYDQKKSKNVP